MTDPRSLNVLSTVEKYLKRDNMWSDVMDARLQGYVAINSATLSNDSLGEVLAAAAVSTAKNDAFTAAYDACVHSHRAIELGNGKLAEMQITQTLRLRSLFGNPFGSPRF